MDDTDKRKAYYDRFVFSQKFAQVDPWSERVSGKDKHEFRPMASVGFAQAPLDQRRGLRRGRRAQGQHQRNDPQSEGSNP
jgi:hypothetical protein